ncbi:MAG: hypothetical protein CMP48_25895 [Rickettsiales bacterium]|nr:hypothetical protein [Rickettsiales bacterium]
MKRISLIVAICTSLSKYAVGQNDLAFYKSHPEYWPLMVSLTSDYRSELFGVVTEMKAGGPYEFIEVEQLLDFVKIYVPTAPEGIKKEYPAEVNRTDFLQRANDYFNNLSEAEKQITYKSLGNYPDKWPDEVKVRRSHKIKSLDKGKIEINYGDMVRPVRMAVDELVIEIDGGQYLIDPVKTDILARVRHEKSDETIELVSKESTTTGPKQVSSQGSYLSQKSKAGSVDQNVVYLEVDRFKDFKEGFAEVTIGNKTGLINSSGEFVYDMTKLTFSNSSRDRLGNYLLMAHGGFSTNGVMKYGVFNLEKKDFEKELQSNRIEFRDDFILEYTDGDHYLITDVFGNQLGPITDYWHDVYSGTQNGSSDGHYKDLSKYPLQRKSTNGLIGFGFPGKGFQIEPAYQQASDFHEGLAAVYKVDAFGKGAWGFIDVNGAEVIPFVFSKKPHDFYNGLSLVFPSDPSKMGFKSAYIDKTGKPYIKLPFLIPDSHENDFVKEVIFTSQAGVSYASFLIINKDGTQTDLQAKLKASIPAYQSIKVEGYTPLLTSSILSVHIFLSNTVNDPYALMDLSGNLLTPPIFKDLGPFDDMAGLAYAKFEKADGTVLEGYVNAEGVFMILKKQESSGW